MKFIISSGELQKALQTVSGVISSSQSRPILENYLFELDGNNVTITASDGETTLVTSLEVKSDDQVNLLFLLKFFRFYQDIWRTASYVCCKRQCGRNWKSA
jgi:DNA polymerase-3 subunit beta